LLGVCTALSLAACGGDDAEVASPTTVVTTSTVPERPTTTTSLVYDPATVEGQVEQAYLRSWDVYADAVYNLKLDEAALASVYGEPHLTSVRDEIKERVNTGRAARFGMEHSYEISILSEETAVVLDRQVNHQVLIDQVSKVPIEGDPAEQIVRAVVLSLSEGAWRVSRIDRAP
jgi:hypothetical protein